MKDNSYEKLEYVVDKFPKFHLNILLGDVSAKLGRDKAAAYLLKGSNCRAGDIAITR
jgi:hypothetical protein